MNSPARAIVKANAVPLEGGKILSIGNSILGDGIING
jgi:hypothetical protein